MTASSFNKRLKAIVGVRDASNKAESRGLYSRANYFYLQGFEFIDGIDASGTIPESDAMMDCEFVEV
jgi:hypothetical protein